MRAADPLARQGIIQVTTEPAVAVALDPNAVQGPCRRMLLVKGVNVFPQRRPDVINKTSPLQPATFDL
ncbi:MAG: hypothetical protein Ct9H300mP14_09120 [Gammaproteobacteria bacterium]|nr:MAG: hypothetical protein Ct9H300mP14_09120 [Gammaproteobacteria bacterium]